MITSIADIVESLTLVEEDLDQHITSAREEDDDDRYEILNQAVSKIGDAMALLEDL